MAEERIWLVRRSVILQVNASFRDDLKVSRIIRGFRVKKFEWDRQLFKKSGTVQKHLFVMVLFIFFGRERNQND